MINITNIEESPKYNKISVSSNDLLSLKSKREYINSLFSQSATYQKDVKRNNGFIHKFNNAIGFKPVVHNFDNFNCSPSPKIESPESYLSPKNLIFESLRTPIVSFSIFEFYIPIKQIEHPNQKYSYNTLDISNKFSDFLKKVFPELIVENELIEELPKQSLRDFAFESFYSQLGENINYTIEFSSSEKLSDDDIAYMLPKLQLLTKDTITIAQFPCKSCTEHSGGKKPYHIEIVYLTWYGKDKREETYKDYGDSIYKLITS